MISDTLFEAIEEIERYEEEFPGTYDYVKEEIADVKERMRSLQMKLDSSPNDIDNKFTN